MGMKLLVVIISYLIGSISPSYIIGKMHSNIDIRHHGSGNAGSTNVLRTMGKRMGALTFLGDYLKGVIAVVLAMKLAGFAGAQIAVLAVVIGHDYPFYLGFKGGKGVATSLGAVSAIDFRVAMVCLLFALIIMAISNMVSLGSMSGFVIAPFMYMYFNHDYEMSMVITIVALTALCLYRHKENIKRIVKGEENKIRK